VYCADRRAGGGTAGVTVERYRLEREDDHIFSRVLEGSATGIHDGQEHVRHMPRSLERVFADHLQSSTNIGPNDFVFCRSAEDSRPHDPDDLRREVLYPVLDRCGIKRTPRADGFHAFRRATSKYLRKANGLELAAVQLGHKRMTTTDEHYNDRDME